MSIPMAVVVLAGVAGGLSLAACGGASLGSESRPKSGAEVVVFAASSLREPFTELARSFEQRHPGARVRLNLAGSSTLVRQLAAGAKTDVLVTADRQSMERGVANGDVGGLPRTLATNELAIIAQPRLRTRVHGLGDLATKRLRLALGAPQVPIGRYTSAAFAKAGHPLPRASQEPSVKAVVTRVALGEADAGVVYRSDLGPVRDRAIGVRLPERHRVTAEYRIALTTAGVRSGPARSFLEYATSRAGDAALSRAGFSPPR
jgi:molybdate transport system substrate-binding protein